MYLYEKYDYALFESRFRDYNRLDAFPKGLRDLFNYLEDISEDNDNPIEIDIDGLCCEFSEISLKDIRREVGLEHVEDDLDLLDELRNLTIVIEVDDETVIYQNF